MPIVLAVFLAIHIAPPASAYSCSSLDRVVPAAGGSLAVHTESCTDVLTYGAWSYYLWTNLTTVRLNNVQGDNVVVADASAHYLSTDGVTTTGQYGHSYSISEYGPDHYATAGANNYWYDQTNWGCQEGSSAGANYGTNSLSGGVGQGVYGGSDPRYILPCSSEDTQQILP
jgi:hypothetical protein